MELKSILADEVDYGPKSAVTTENGEHGEFQKMTSLSLTVLKVTEAPDTPSP